MFKKFKLRQKFTTFLALILLMGVVLTGLTLSTVLQRNAQREVADTALILMETMNSVREYTDSQVNPELSEQLTEQFLPETVPAYSAREVFEHFRTSSSYGDFFYKEATINPTNLRDKADEFETNIVEQFRADTGKTEVDGFRVAQGRRIFYIARPITVSKASCLECHSTPDAAPASMVEYYGPNNGFGWSEGEIVGAQMISVPASTVIAKANRATLLMTGIVTAIFAIIILLINYLLSQQVVQPIKRMVKVAEEVSRGNMGVEFEQDTEDEMGTLARAFTRMQRSLMMAMDRISRTSGRNSNNRSGNSHVNSGSNSAAPSGHAAEFGKP